VARQKLNSPIYHLKFQLSFSKITNLISLLFLIFFGTFISTVEIWFLSTLLKYVIILCTYHQECLLFFFLILISFHYLYFCCIIYLVVDHIYLSFGKRVLLVSFICLNIRFISNLLNLVIWGLICFSKLLKKFYQLIMNLASFLIFVFYLKFLLQKLVIKNSSESATINIGEDVGTKEPMSLHCW
jgi:hypothetical protein